MEEHPIILFDGICNFCNSAVNFVIRHDKRGRIRFAALQSVAGQALLARYQLPTSIFDTFIFLENGKVYTRSTAALRLSRYLSGAWPVFYGFIIVPEFIRNWLYNFVARNRYKWFGQKQSCMVPGPQIRQRFL